MSIMKINGSVVNGLTLSGQNVVRILRDDEVLWEKTSIDYFYLENETEYLGTFTCTRNGSPAAPNLEYSTDGVNWTTADMSATWSVPVQPNRKLYLRGDNGTDGFNSSSNDYYTFSMDKAHTIGGNIMSIQNHNTMDTVNTIPRYCFYYLFNQDANLTHASNVKFENIQTVNFSGCHNMFMDCTSLMEPCNFPQIEYLDSNAFNCMYFGCISLSTPSNISTVKTIKGSACANMYHGCNKLTAGSDISNAATLATGSCYGMYTGCYKLQTIYAPNIAAWSTSIFNNWVQNAGNTAATPKIMYFKTQELMDSWPSGNSGYGNYVKTLIPKPTPTVYELKINNELDGITYDVDGGNEIFLPNTYGDLGVIEVSGTASTITFHDAEPSKLRIIEFSSTTTGGRVDGYAIDLATFDTTRQIHIYEH